LDQLPKRVVAERRPEPLVHQLVELCPRRRAVVLLDKGKPFSGITHLLEGRKEHLASLLSALDTKKLLTSIKPGQRILRTIVRQEEQLVAMAIGSRMALLLTEPSA
jgi:hypothetical protein